MQLVKIIISVPTVTLLLDIYIPYCTKCCYSKKTKFFKSDKNYAGQKIMSEKKIFKEKLYLTKKYFQIENFIITQIPLYFFNPFLLNVPF